MSDLMEILFYMFVFCAQILGEVYHFYIFYPVWDLLLHSLSGFLFASIGFSILNNYKIKTILVALIFSISFSLANALIWEFFEYSSDKILHTDMQKDILVSDVYSVLVDESKNNQPVNIKNIKNTIIKVDSGDTVINNGYIDIGLNDTMKDLIVNLVGAVTFSIVGLFYIKDRDGYKFAEMFIPTIKNG